MKHPLTEYQGKAVVVKHHDEPGHACEGCVAHVRGLYCGAVSLVSNSCGDALGGTGYYAYAEPARLPWEEAMREPGMLLVGDRPATSVTQYGNGMFGVHCDTDMAWSYVVVDKNGQFIDGEQAVKLNPNYRRPAPILASSPVEYAGMRLEVQP